MHTDHSTLSRYLSQPCCYCIVVNHDRKLICGLPLLDAVSLAENLRAYPWEDGPHTFTIAIDADHPAGKAVLS
jgi:hypothetical protein